MSRRILHKNSVPARVSEPADELEQGTAWLHVEVLDDGQAILTTVDADGGLVVVEVARQPLLDALHDEAAPMSSRVRWPHPAVFHRETARCLTCGLYAQDTAPWTLGRVAVTADPDGVRQHRVVRDDG